MAVRKAWHWSQAFHSLTLTGHISLSRFQHLQPPPVLCSAEVSDIQSRHQRERPRLGSATAVLPQELDRKPLWEQTEQGSLSHSNMHCVKPSIRLLLCSQTAVLDTYPVLLSLATLLRVALLEQPDRTKWPPEASSNLSQNNSAKKQFAGAEGSAAHTDELLPTPFFSSGPSEEASCWALLHNPNMNLVFQLVFSIPSWVLLQEMCTLEPSHPRHLWSWWPSCVEVLGATDGAWHRNQTALSQPQRGREVKGKCTMDQNTQQWDGTAHWCAQSPWFLSMQSSESLYFSLWLPVIQISRLRNNCHKLNFARLQTGAINSRRKSGGLMGLQKIVHLQRLEYWISDILFKHRAGALSS